MEAKQRSVFITGGGTGLGAAVARGLAADGWRVGLSGRRAGVLETLARELRDAGAKIETYALDVTDDTNTGPNFGPAVSLPAMKVLSMDRKPRLPADCAGPPTDAAAPIPPP